MAGSGRISATIVEVIVDTCRSLLLASPAPENRFLFHNDQTETGVHIASYVMGTGFISRGLKRR
jgi:hypothetical protein